MCSAGSSAVPVSTQCKVVKKKHQKLTYTCLGSLHFVHKTLNLLGTVLMKVKERAWKQGL